MPRTSIPCLLLAFVLAGEVRAATPPQTPAGRRVAELIEAYNLGTDDALVRFVAANYPPKANAQRIAAYWRNLYREFGPVAVHSTLIDQPLEVEVWTRGTTSEAWVTFNLSVSKDPPHLIAGSGIGRGIWPPNLPAKRAASDKELIAAVGAYLDRLAKADLFSGSVAIGRSGRVLFSKAYGIANRDFGIANTASTRFNVASLSKMFTAVAALQLVERGVLRLDDPIAKFIPEYPKPIGDEVTVRRLLTHTSSIELDDDAGYVDEARRVRSLEKLLATHLKYASKLTFERKDTFDYTNEGYDLLGILIERASKQPFESVLAKNVFERAHMAHTQAYDVERVMANIATGYTPRDGATGAFHLGELLKNALWLSSISTPAGEHYSTSLDLVRFGEALLANELLGAALTKEALSPQVTQSETSAYGFGFEIVRRGNAVIVGHSGGLPGSSARLDIYTDSGHVVSVLANYGWVANNVANRISELLTGQGGF